MQDFIGAALAWPKEYYAGFFVFGCLIGFPLFLWSSRWQPFIIGLLLIVMAVISLGLIIAAP